MAITETIQNIERILARLEKIIVTRGNPSVPVPKENEWLREERDGYKWKVDQLRSELNEMNRDFENLRRTAGEQR